MPDIDLSYAVGLAPRDAIHYFESKGHKITFNWHDMWQEAHARAFTVAGIGRMDILQDIHGALAQALREGKTGKWFADTLTPILQKKGWWGKKTTVDPQTGEVRTVKQATPDRVQLWWEQNIQTSYMVGRYQQHKANASSRPWWKYVCANLPTSRAAHKLLHGKVFHCDDPFWDTHHPPNGFRCKCDVHALSAANLHREEITPEKSEGHMVRREIETLNRQTGEVQQRSVAGYRMDNGAVFWTDAGFSYNPGKEYLGGALQSALARLDQTPATLARPAVEHMVRGTAFSHWYSNAKGNFPLAVLPDEDSAALGASTSVARLSAQTLEKQRKHHPELDVADYQSAQEAVDKGRKKQEGTKMHYVLEKPGGVVVVVKATQDGGEMYVVSLWRLSRDEAKRNRIVQQILGQ